MANYSRTTLVSRYDSTSDFSSANASVASFTATKTTPTKQLDVTLSVTTSGYTLDLSMFSAITSVVIENQDSTNFVEAQFTDQSTANKIKIPNNDFVKLASIGTISADLVLDADTATCVVRVIISGT